MKSEEETDRKIALAVLQLNDTCSVTGKRPSLEELWDWMHGELSDTRGNEIRSHLANDDDLYEDWRQLRIAEQESTESSVPALVSEKSKLQRILQFCATLPANPGGRVAGGAVALCFALVIGLQFMQSQPSADFWQNWQPRKSVTANSLTTSVKHDLQAVLVGMQQKMHELFFAPTGPEGEKLPTELASCEDPAGCTERYAALVELGQLVVTARLDCLSQNPLRSNIQPRVTVLLEKLESYSAPPLLLTPVRRLAASTTQDKRASCNAIESLISRALTGLD